MAAILDLSNMAPTAGAQLGSRKKSKVYNLGYMWSQLVLVERFEQFRCKYGLSPLTSTRLRSYGDRASSVKAPSLWNLFSMHMRTMSWMSTFNKVLKTHFFQMAFDDV